MFAHSLQGKEPLHDIGKVSAEYQAYIASPWEEGRKGPDHSTAGAREATACYRGMLGRILAYAIAGHHAGLADAENLTRRLSAGDYSIKDYSGWQEHCGALPEAGALQPKTGFRLASEKGFSETFLTRMIFSCLVDADFLETEAFYVRAEGGEPDRGNHLPIDVLRDRLRVHMTAKRNGSSPVNILRGRILDHAVQKAELEPGLFTLTVPTGGGKTLASLSFALDHAVRHRLRRVLYIIPYTSIIEQTAQVFREALGTTEDVLEHHATFDWEPPRNVADADDEGQAGLNKLRKAAENWDAPIVVTTAVQFYESLFAARTSRCRKLHNLAGAVIVLDEAQTLPANLLRPCLAAVDELTRNYRTSAVICTATQPAWRKLDGALPAGLGLEIGPERELAPDPHDLYERLRRVAVEARGVTTDADIVARFTEQDRMLCIVNTRQHARALFDAIRHLPGAVHLSTLMCPRHRRAALAGVREKLGRQEAVRLVATSLIEAGVDVDFPEVWRAEAGLDSIAQAAGRCNREGRLISGRVVVFAPAEVKPPQNQRVFQQAMREVMRRGHDDLLGLAANRDYFEEVYFQKGLEALDTTEVGGRVGVMRLISEGASRLNVPFRGIADAFRLIEEVMEPVIVPWDAEAVALLAVLRQRDRPSTAHLRKLQQYVVSIPRAARDEWLKRGALEAAHPALADGLLVFTDASLYREETGVDLDHTTYRKAADNIIGD